MDYDDNDIQNQNIQLVGEDSNRFPQSFQLVHLPRFDIDDHLQAHLGFDNIVETEGLLGIQDQGINWIEDFSLGGSAIEFSSSAAESCSIPRHNVWSEAMSSEAVEMLLRSVGEEEMIDPKTIIKEADDHDGLNSMDGDTDTCLSLKKSLNSELKDVVHCYTTLTPEKSQNSLLRLNEDEFMVHTHFESINRNSGDEKNGIHANVGSLHKFNSEGKIVANEVAIRVQPQFEGMCPASKDGKFVVDVDANSLGEQSNSERKIVTNQHRLDETGTSSSDYVNEKSLAIDESICQVALGNSNTITCSSQDDPSSEFTPKLVSPGKLNTEMPSKQVIEECCEIGITEKFGLSSAQKDSIHTIGSKVIDLPSQGLTVKVGPCTGKGPSVLEPTMDSLDVLNEGCNNSAYSENPDELLKAITYQSKALMEGTLTVDTVVPQTKEKYSLVMGDSDTIKSSDGINNEGMAELSNLTEGLKNVGDRELEDFSRSDSAHVQRTMSMERTTLDSYEASKNCLVEATEEEQEPEIQLNRSNSTDGENTFNTKEMPASVDMSSEMSITEARDGDAFRYNLLNLVSESPILTSKCAEGNIKQPEVRLNVLQGDTLEESQLPASLDDAQKTASSIPCEPFLSVDNLAVEPYHHKIPIEVVSIVNNDTAPLINSGVENSNASSAVQESIISTMDCSSAKNLVPEEQILLESAEVFDLVVQDDSSTKDMVHDDPGVKTVPVNDSINAQHSASGDIMVVDVAVEQKEPPSVVHAPEFIHSTENVKEATWSGSGKDSSTVCQTGIQPVIGQSSSYAVEGSVFVGCYNESNSSVDDAVIDEHPTWVEGNMFVHASVKGDGSADSSGENEKTTLIRLEAASNGERRAIPVPPPSNSFSSGDCQNSQQSGEPNIALGDNYRGQNSMIQTEDDSPSCHTNNSSESLTVTRNAESNVLEAGSDNPSSFEENCGSPIIISCNEHSQDAIDREGNSGFPYQGELSAEIHLVPFETRENDDKLEPKAPDSKESIASEDDKGFTFEVGSTQNLSQRVGGHEWKPFPNARSIEPQLSKEISEPPLLNSKEGEPKETPFREKTTERDGSPCITSPKSCGTKSKINVKTIERDGSSCIASPKSGGTKSKSNVETSVKASCTPTVQTSSLPDLNNLVFASGLFNHPFTDLQQVQLRAQIFVYGSLIQGVPPDEACMISAFGDSDSGHSLWKVLWSVSVERYQKQKSPSSNFETPHSRSGIRISEQVTRISSLEFNPIPLPSPQWSIPTRDGSHSNIPRVAHLDFSQAVTPLNSHQSSQIRQLAGNNVSLISQSPHPGTWVVSSQSSSLVSPVKYSVVPVAETIQVTPVRDSSLLYPLHTQLLSSTPLLLAPRAASVSSAPVVQMGTVRKTSTPGNNRSLSTIQRSRKKKAGLPEELQPTTSVSQPVVASQPLVEPVSVISHSKCSASASAGLSANSPTKATSGDLVLPKSNTICTTHCEIVSGNDNKVILTEETQGIKIEQAKLLAEDAATLATSAVRHCQSIWSQLATQKISGLVSEVEEKLVSASVAASAAASVAKAAAAAARVASEAALQAKMMADEALISVKIGNFLNVSEVGLAKNLTKLTPIPILKEKEKVHGSSSIISAAREAARKRLEAASAASKRAENLDAIVKAAEIAAEAVSQAGTIIAMGDPLPFTLSELVKAGPDGHWRVHNSTTDEDRKTVSLQQLENISLDCDESVRKATDTEGMLGFSEHDPSEKHYIGKGSDNASSAIPTDFEKDHSENNHEENIIQKGSLVEVVSEENDLGRVWYSSRVLEVDNCKAYICYNGRLPNEGTGPLKEWISLEVKGDKCPRIRLAHPMTTAKYEGTRKRRREALGDYVWAVGDRVEAWIRDGWREGIITEMSQGDDTKLTVHFSGGGDSSIVRAWDLRPSLIWKDGQWIEWSRTRENVLQHYQGDTPQEKRQKLVGSLEARTDTEIDGKVILEPSKNISAENIRKPEEAKPLNLSANDKTFCIGKDAKGEINADPLRVMRTGLQKGGPRVIFGVPKPGKKRKFMEVSRHYVSEKAKNTTEGNEPIKISKYLMPQTSSVWRNTSKVDVKGNIAGDSRLKSIKSVKSHSIPTRSIAEKDKATTSAASNTGESAHGSLSNTRAVFRNGQNDLGKNIQLEVGPSANKLGRKKDSLVEPLGKFTHSMVKPDKSEAYMGMRGKPTHGMVKPTKSEDRGQENPGKIITGAPEPRRSNRRIQPTSRLLEGLQSSLTVSKIPSMSHDKGNKGQFRTASSRGNTHG